jgi:cholesterol transport system auxiliary component
MTPRSMSTICALCWFLSACALTSKSDPWITRYFTPEYAGRATGQGAATSSVSSADGEAARPRLRLGRVSAGAHLRQRIAYRSATHELGYYEDLRWTEKPDVYLRRALSRALYEERGAVRVVAGGAPTLDVELVAFEEVRGKRPRARLQAGVMLHDQRFGRLEQTIVVEHPIANTDGDDATAAVVDALANTLQDAVARIADLSLAKLSAVARTSACDCQPAQTASASR